MLGVIADDLTGATDAACMIRRRGLSVTQVIGIPSEPLNASVDAVVVSLKSRSIPSDEAVEISKAAMSWLAGNGATQFYFKYCSTFDSTPRGNIGPVAAALAEHLDQISTAFVPSFPENGRTVYRGHMFVGDRLISESSLATHPLNPMTDPDLVRVLAQQSGEIPITNLSVTVLDQGVEAVEAWLAELDNRGGGFVIVDTLKDEHIDIAAKALQRTAFVTGGSPLCGALSISHKNARDASSLRIEPEAGDGAVAVLAGSCSQTTRAQLKRVEREHDIIWLDPLEIYRDSSVLPRLKDQAINQAKSGVVIIASSSDPAKVSVVHADLGEAKAGALIEQTHGELARALFENGIQVFVVAGGETSGAVAEALCVDQLAIGREIAPGVPWTKALGAKDLRMTFKSGNFGNEDFFLSAIQSVRAST